MRYRLLAFAITALFAIDLAAAKGADRTQETLKLINVYRAQHGLDPLLMEARLSVLARDQAEDLLASRRVDLRSSKRVPLEKQLRRAGYAYRQAFQQIATGYPNGKAVVDMWLRRRDSRQILLNRDLSEAGIGYAHRKGANLDHYWVITIAEPTRPAAANWRREIMHYVNQYRAKHKLPSVTLNPKLNRTAQSHSDDMAARDFFDHVTPSGKSVSDRATRAGYRWQAILENLAAGQDSPREVVTGWINSPPHREVLLEPDIEDAGVGYTFLAQDGGLVQMYHYWTLNMGLSAK